jgi:N-6 DNA Methylase
MSRDFIQAAIYLINQLKNKDLRDFITNHLQISEQFNVDDNLNPLINFEQSRCDRLGAFYTPSHLANYIFNKITIQKNQTYLDPGVGIGNLISPLINQIISNYPDISLEEVVNSIYGFDIDKETIEICKIRIILELQKYFNVDKNTYTQLNIFFSDFTIKPLTITDYLNQFNLVYQDTDNVLKIKENLKFDYIIGNPPFITFYGRRSKKLSETYREYYLKNYDFISDYVQNGKLNLYMFFVENGINMLKKNGQLVYILDNSIYETPAYYLRHWILENFQIISIDMGLTDFANVASGQTLWHIINLPPSKVVLVQDISQKTSQLINQKTWLNNRECKISFHEQTQNFNSILNQINELPKLADYFPDKSIRTCCMLLNLTEKFLVSKDIYENDKSGLIMPYLEGSKSLINPDEDLIFNNYIKYDYQLQLEISEQIRIELEKQGIKNKKRIGLGKLEIYQSPKIFIRQSSHKLIAKFTKHNFMANNSLYVITPIYSAFKKEDWEKTLIYTERLLCSKLYLYLAYKMKVIRKNPKQQPQIKVSDLKRLPFLINQNSSFFDHIVNIHPVNRNLIDQMIYENFQITHQEINEIGSFSKSV